MDRAGGGSGVKPGGQQSVFSPRASKILAPALSVSTNTAHLDVGFV